MTIKHVRFWGVKMCDKMAISAYILKTVEKNPFLRLQMRAKEMFNRHQFHQVQCLEVFCYHGNKSTSLLFYSIFRTTPEVSIKLYFVEICQVSEKLWLFNHKRADFWFPNFGCKRSLLSLLKKKNSNFKFVVSELCGISLWGIEHHRDSSKLRIFS